MFPEKNEIVACRQSVANQPRIGFRMLPNGNLTLAKYQTASGPSTVERVIVFAVALTENFGQLKIKFFSA